MINKKRGNTKLVNPVSGLMECIVCGSRWYASIKPASNGNYFRGAWQCPSGCNKGKSK
ncbi:MAG TPA: hypothetical protein VE090_02330 [Methylomirabilota bacterium]|nr:hypothetical protein [Methylomirabilota bacterium]